MTITHKTWASWGGRNFNNIPLSTYRPEPLQMPHGSMPLCSNQAPAATFRMPCRHHTNYSPILTRKSVTPLPTLTSSYYLLLSVVFAGPIRWTGKKTEIELNPTAKDRTTGCGCTNSEFFQLPVATFVEKSKNRKKPV